MSHCEQLTPVLRIGVIHGRNLPLPVIARTPRFAGDAAISLFLRLLRHAWGVTRNDSFVTFHEIINFEL
jgi:hypothetical protein